MKVVVIGMGQVGQELAKELIQKKHDVTVVDVNKNIVDVFTNKYDAIGIIGSGASRLIQEKARCDIADIVIAVTDTDEINLMSCLTAKYLGTKYTIAKVKSLEFNNNDEFLRNKFNIDLVINSERSTADEITRIVSYPSNIRVEHFLESKINMAEVTIREDSTIIGSSIKELEQKFKNQINIGCIIRKNKVIIANSEIKFEKGDIVYVLANIIKSQKFLKNNKLIDKPVKSVLMVGSGNIGDTVINNLLKMGIKVKVIEFDLKRCQELSEKYEEAEVVFGEEINSDLLLEEGIKDFDCCISLTKNDESNLVTSMFAWSCNTRKVITKISSVAYTSMLHNVKIDTTVSPYSIIVSSVIRYIRSIKNSMDDSIKEFYRFANNQADAIEFLIDEEYSYCDKKLGELKIKPTVLIAFIVRGKEVKEVIVPDDNQEIHKGDRVIVIAKASEGIGKLEDIFL